MNSFEFGNLDDIIHNRIFSVPDYQRDYSWGKSEVTTLLEDIFKLADTNFSNETDNHFCGPIVTIDFDSDVSKNTAASLNSRTIKNFTKVNIIDGQQRLSTLSILLIAIRDFCHDREIELDTDLTSYIDTNRKDDDGKGIPVLNFSTVATQNCYNEYLYKGTAYSYEKNNAGVKKIKETYSLCKNALDEFETLYKGTELQTRLTELLNQVLFHLTFVPIHCKEGSDAYQIFESLNATGLSLTPAEQVKNLLLMNSNNRVKTLSNWDEIVTLVDEKRIVKFLSHYLFYKKHERVSQKDIYKEFKNKLKMQNVTDLMDEMLLDAKIYHSLRNPSLNNISSTILIDFDDLNQEQVFVPLLATAVRFDVNGHDFKKIADSILVFLVRHLVCQQSSNALDTIFGKACEMLTNEVNTAQDIADFFKSKQQNDEAFEFNFKNLSFDFSAKPQKTARTYLRRIEEVSHGSDKPMKLNPSDLSVEHIIPKSSDGSINSWLGYEYDESNTELKNKIDQATKSVGNLALLYRCENSSASNLSYPEKVEVYTSAYHDDVNGDRGVPSEVFNLIRELIHDNPESFTINDVEDRSSRLAKMAVKAWR